MLFVIKPIVVCRTFPKSSLILTVFGEILAEIMNNTKLPV